MFANSYRYVYNEGMKDKNAVALGRKGGKARAKNLTPEERKDSARKAVLARWAKEKAQKS